MVVKCGEIIEIMNKLAPSHLAENWDNVGLQLGDSSREVNNLLVTVDVTPELANWAMGNNIDLIIAHHPLIFKPLSNLRTDTAVGRTIASLIKADIALFVAHTNLDAAACGVSDTLAEVLGLVNIRPLTDEGENLIKLVVFVPESDAQQVMQAVTAAGAGHIGNYSHCTFQAQGTGTFMPLEGSNPYLGEQGRMEYVREVRIETIMREDNCNTIVQAMLAAHPYEEVAYDLYNLRNKAQVSGLGRIGQLSPEMTLNEFTAVLKRNLAVSNVRVSGPVDRLVKNVAVCGGAGMDLVKNAISAGADVYVTGDVKYHEAMDAALAGLTIVDAGHFATERPIVEKVAAYIKENAVRNGWTLNIATDFINKDIFSTF
jgi:dinuclear metal center YbgI/SA1388 family protein